MLTANQTPTNIEKQKLNFGPNQTTTFQFTGEKTVDVSVHTSPNTCMCISCAQMPGRRQAISQIALQRRCVLHSEPTAHGHGQRIY